MNLLKVIDLCDDSLWVLFNFVKEYNIKCVNSIETAPPPPKPESDRGEGCWVGGVIYCLRKYIANIR